MIELLSRYERVKILQTLLEPQLFLVVNKGDDVSGWLARKWVLPKEANQCVSVWSLLAVAVPLNSQAKGFRS